MKRLACMCILITVMLLAACDEKPNNDHIHAFNIVASRPYLDDGRAVLNPGIDGGRFELQGHVESEAVKSVSILLSPTPNWAQSNATWFYFESGDKCKGDSFDPLDLYPVHEPCKGLYFTISCQIRTDYAIECNRGTNSMTTADNGFFAALPKDAYLIAVACRGEDACSTKVRGIRVE